MTDEAMKSACSRAEELSNVVKSADLRGDAFRVILQAFLIGPGQTPAGSKNEPATLVHPAEGKSKARRAGLKSRISSLVDEDFFATARSTRDVGEALKVSGWNHSNDEISARLLDLVRARVLRRTEGQRDSKKAMLYSTL